MEAGHGLFVQLRNSRQSAAITTVTATVQLIFA
jgi:hypothetical protein